VTVVGLTGLAGAGKSTVAKYLVETYEYNLVSFAGPLKKMMRTLDPYIGLERVRWWQFWKQPKMLRLSDLLAVMSEGEIKTSQYGAEYRRLLQSLGTDCIRAVDPDFWVNAALAQVTDPDKKFVFDDVRFPNEAAAIKEINWNGLWNVDRPGIKAGEHISEKYAGQLGESVIIDNQDLMETYATLDYLATVSSSGKTILATGANISVE
jgi:hypothetical protein